MSELDIRIASFLEHVVRPLSDDWKTILQELRTLNIGIDQQTVKEVAFALGLWHLIGEVIRAVSFVSMTWMVCQTVRAVWFVS